MLSQFADRGAAIPNESADPGFLKNLSDLRIVSPTCPDPTGGDPETYARSQTEFRATFSDQGVLDPGGSPTVVSGKAGVSEVLLPV